MTEETIRWIAVADELPPYRKRVLALNGEGEVHTGQRLLRSKKQFRLQTAITYWAQMPKGPTASQSQRSSEAK